MGRTLRSMVAVAGAGAALLLLAASAHATFPGENGRLTLAILEGGRQTVATVNPDGSGLTRLTSEAEETYFPAWSADGRRIAFAAKAPGEAADLLTMDADGGNRTQVTTGPPTDPPAQEQAWAPDGATLVMSEGVNLYTAAADGSGWEFIGGDAGLNPVFSPDWSPDGQHIAFVRAGSTVFCDEEGECNTSFATDIWVMRTDRPGAVQLTNDGGRDSFPSWSPDGERLLFVHENLLTVMDADGGNRATLLPDRAVQGVWSPDGTQIAFSDNEDLYVMKADGSDVIRILDGAISGPRYTAPDWQPLPNRPPDCSGIRAEPSVLWPPNHRLRRVTLSSATDPDGDDVTVDVTGVTQDERVGRHADARRTRSPDTVRLRAERRPRHDGRVYRIAFRASDDQGGECEGVVGVAVPRHKRRPAVDSAPPSFDSFGS